MNLMKHLKSINETFRISHVEPNVTTAMNEVIVSWLPKLPREYVVVCIGTDRSTGDALGPLTGTFFSEMKPKHITVYGTLENPVHATNLKDYISKIEANHRNPFIIAIDACLGKTSSVGQLIANIGPLKPGAALNKTLPPVGDIHITGVVNIGGYMEYSVLQNTRLSIVVDMSKKIAMILDLLDQQLTSSYNLPAVVTRHIKETS